MMKPFMHHQVRAKFDTYPPEARRRLLALRELVFQTAENTSGVGELEESLKWGEPAYAPKNKAGSTLRIDWKEKDPLNYAMYFHCQTNLVETFRTIFPHDFTFQGNRALILRLEDEAPQDALAICIAAALTYHLKK
ncbi:DUF1801 domain-containing protein [Herminiimonas glaciei]|uniref:DUF1801 domain-containing protein n=1 Tax=Herminiimonas glaciei TaxID=523788 RepID=A0ABW2I9G7_9BURK